MKSLLVEHITEASGLYFRSITLPEAGTYIPQHTHDHDHATLVCSGKARAWCDGICIGDKGKGEVFEVTAGHKHEFVSLEPNTMMVCIHNIESAMSIKQKGL